MLSTQAVCSCFCHVIPKVNRKSCLHFPPISAELSPPNHWGPTIEYLRLRLSPPFPWTYVVFGPWVGQGKAEAVSSISMDLRRVLDRG
ncbi:hypothetical protein ACOMHN_047297 [Nucella lapillus]